MKKNLSILLSIMMIVGILLAACAPKATEAPAAPAADEPAAAPTEAPAAAPAEDTTVSMVPAQPGSPLISKAKQSATSSPLLRILS